MELCRPSRGRDDGARQNVRVDHGGESWLRQTEQRIQVEILVHQQYDWRSDLTGSIGSASITLKHDALCAKDLQN
jgi:hypothetical protein